MEPFFFNLKCTFKFRISNFDFNIVSSLLTFEF